MTLLRLLFYIIAVLILLSTAMAVTRRDLVHAVLYLVLSFFGTAGLFYLLGAPFLAALEVIIYAGAIMVLFLFLIMMIRLQKQPGMYFPFKQLWPALVIGLGFVATSVLAMAMDTAGRVPLAAAQGHPVEFGIYLFRHHGLGVEIASMLLLIALIGAYLMARRIGRPSENSAEKAP